MHGWLEKNYPTVESRIGKCEKVTKELNDILVHLTRVRGFYHCPIWGRREHWWLVNDFTDEIFDPTAAQFPSKGITGVYEEWDEEQEEPVGMCMDCGDYVYPPRLAFCSDKCEKRGMAYLNDKEPL